MPDLTWAVENVIARTSLSLAVDLQAIANAFPKHDYFGKQLFSVIPASEHLPYAVFRLSKPETATTLDKEGNMVCTGAKTSAEAEEAVRIILARKAEKGLLPTGLDPTIDIRNIVASGYIGGRVDLSKTHAAIPNSVYESDRDPCLIHRLTQPRATVMLYASGKIVSTGLTDEAMVPKVFQEMRQILSEKGLLRE